MAKRNKSSVFLENITDIPMECSDVENEELYDSEGELLDKQSDPHGRNNKSVDIESSDSVISDKSNEDESSDSSNTRKRRCLPFPSSSSDEDESETEISKDGTIWKKIKEEHVAGRLSLSRIFKDTPGPTAYAKRNIKKEEISSAFLLVIDHSILEHVRTCTKLEASRVLKKKWIFPQAKLKAFIALLYARGAYEAKTLRLEYLWNTKWGPEFFSKTMSRNDFTEILRFIRFDKKNVRSQRLQTDKFALVSTVWNKFLQNSQNCFKPGAYITVDEQLFPTNARCRFIQYMPNKPDKFGIKFWLASDVKTKYVINGFPYLGKDDTRDSSTPLSEFVVLKLLEPYTMKGRTITTDNFFTSIPLALKLLSKNGCTLTIYKSQPKKKVFLLSSKHKHIKIDETTKKLPETVSFYNNTKFGVNVTDQMARKYSVKLGSRRWPLQVFFNILDLAGINAWILYKNTTGENISRKDFLFRLAEELASEYQISRKLPQESGIPAADKSNSSSTLHTRKWCQIGYCNNNKTTTICNACKKAVCGKCTQSKIYICKNCSKFNTTTT